MSDPFQGIKLDPGDDFDKVVFMESRLQQDGYNEGFKTGKMTGYDDGFRLGLENGREIGREIGFYIGFVEMWLSLSQYDQSIKKRTEKILYQLKDMLNGFPLSSPEDITMQDKLTDIRAKFKQVSSVLKLPTQTNTDTSQISF